MRTSILLCLVLASVCLIDASIFSNPREKLMRYKEIAEAPRILYSETGDKPRLVTEGSVTQPLDHFSDTNTEVFQQRFLITYDHYTSGYNYPLFILIGGHSPINPGYLQDGILYELAEEHNAAIFALEHRFYGTSYPSGRRADMDTLQYLTVYQSLADMSRLVTLLRETLPQFIDSPAILFGYSEGGSLVTYFQKDYFDIIQGAWVSSAGTWAKADFFEATEVAGAVLRTWGGEECYRRIERAFDELDRLFDAQDYSTIREELGICPDMNIESDYGTWTINAELAADFESLASISDRQTFNIACDVVMAGESDLDGLARISTVLFRRDCVGFDYNLILDILREDEWVDEYSMTTRLSVYQYCSEFGWYPSSSSDHHPFGNYFPVQLFYTLCSNVFDLTAEEILAGIDSINEHFGGLEPEVVNIITTQGMNDPLRPAGVQDNFSDTATAFVFPNLGHITEVQRYYEGFSQPEVEWAQREVRDAIAGFLDMYYESKK